MIRDWFNDLIAFRRATDLPIGTTPIGDPTPMENELIREEFYELLESLDECDPVAIAKEAIDLVYVTLGMLARRGIDPRPVWDAVHADNMAKAGGPKREDGKALKPPGWTPTDLAPILARQVSLSTFTPMTQIIGRAHRQVPEQLADEWIKRTGREPHQYSQFSPHVNQYRWCRHLGLFFDPDDLPGPIWDRLKFTKTSSIERRYQAYDLAFADLRQALVSLINDGIPLPELTKGDAP